MKVVIHIGQPKTGTSKLQHTFRENRQELLNQGVLYPQTGTVSHHGDLAIAAKKKVPRSLVSRLGSDVERASAASHDAWSAVGEQVRELSPDMVVISSEYLFSTPRAKRIPELVRQHIDPHADVTFLAYLRVPSEQYTSQLQQRVKASYKVPAGRPSLLARLDTFAACGDLVVRKFARSELESEDIVADVCHTLEIDPAPLKMVDGGSNATVSAEGIILLQRYRQIVHANHEDVFKKDSNDLISRILDEENRNPRTYTKPALRPPYAQLLDAETPETREIESRYGITLSKDHGVKPARRRSIHQLQDPAMLIKFDTQLLDKMLHACDLPSLITRHRRR